MKVGLMVPIHLKYLKVEFMVDCNVGKLVNSNSIFKGTNFVLNDTKIYKQEFSWALDPSAPVYLFIKNCALKKFCSFNH